MLRKAFFSTIAAIAVLIGLCCSAFAQDESNPDLELGKQVKKYIDNIKDQILIQNAADKIDDLGHRALNAVNDGIKSVTDYEPVPFEMLSNNYGVTTDGGYQLIVPKSQTPDVDRITGNDMKFIQRYWPDKGGLLAQLDLNHHNTYSGNYFLTTIVIVNMAGSAKKSIQYNTKENHLESPDKGPSETLGVFKLDKIPSVISGDINTSQCFGFSDFIGVIDQFKKWEKS